MPSPRAPLRFGPTERREYEEFEGKKVSRKKMEDTEGALTSSLSEEQSKQSVW